MLLSLLLLVVEGEGRVTGGVSRVQRYLTHNETKSNLGHTYKEENYALLF